MTMIAPEVLPPQFGEGSETNLIPIGSSSSEDKTGPFSWWRRHAKKGRCRQLFKLTFILICGLLMVALILKKFRRSPVCSGKECEKYANFLMANLDESVDPCENFYEFACGNFIKSATIHEDEGEVSLWWNVENKKSDLIRVIAEGDGPRGFWGPPKSFNLVKNLYKSCMNTSQIERVGLTFMKNYFDKLGGWPVLHSGDGSSIRGSWDSTNFSWTDTIVRFHRHGFSHEYLLSITFDADLKHSTINTIYLSTPSFHFDEQFLRRPLTDPILRAYAKYQIELAVLFGSNRAKAETDMGAVLKFERQLALIALPSAKRNESKSYNLMTIRDLTSKYPSIPWLKLINDIISFYRMKIQVDEPVIVDDPIFLSKLEKLINQSEKRTLANFLMCRMVMDQVHYLTGAARDLYFDFSKVFTGVVKPRPRWRECVDIVHTNLPVAVGSHYVRQFYDSEKTELVSDMVDNIRAAFLKILNGLQWMDEGTREKAKKKLTAMSSFVGYPPEILDNYSVERYYGRLTMAGDAYHENILRWNRFFTSYNFENLRTPVNKMDWWRFAASASTGAFYYVSQNSFHIHAGILQDIFFEVDRPNYLNYGAIGWTIGHEMTHGFDDVGIQYDGNGNLGEWWDPKTKKKYLEKVQCIIYQYDNYKVRQLHGLKISGFQTQGENIADNGGLKEAYRAYVHWTEVNGEEPKLPGLNYTTRQLFWISAANVWCGKYRPGALKQQILTDEHSPGEFRVRGPMSNLEEFSRDFNCSKGSGMNPIKKCSVW